MNELTELKKRNNKLLQEIERLKKKIAIVNRNYDLYCRMEEENIELKEKLKRSLDIEKLIDPLEQETLDKLREILNEKDNSYSYNNHNY